MMKVFANRNKEVGSNKKGILMFLLSTIQSNVKNDASTMIYYIVFLI